MVLYYGVTLAENLLLATLWSLETRTLLHHTKKDRTDTFLLVSLPFAGGILFMLVYYKYFHAKKLGSTMEGMELHTKAVETKLPARGTTIKNCIRVPGIILTQICPRLFLHGSYV